MDEPIRVPPTPAMRRFAQENGFSAEIVARWDRFYPDVIGLVRSFGRPPPVWIRTNPLVADPAQTIERLRAKGFRLERGPIPDAWRIHTAPISPGATDEYLLGRYQLQDVSTQLAVLALEPKSDERVLDLAAAPGIKTIQIAQAMDNEGVVHAFDVDAQRARALRSNLARCGVRNVIIHVRDGADAANLPENADRVLLDAPCTGEGVIQRDPTRKRGYLAEYAACARQQASLLDAAVAALKPGGRIAYATCTLAPEENEFQVDRAVRDHPLRVLSLPSSITGLEIGGKPLVGGITAPTGTELDDGVAHTRHTLPHVHGCLGFFLALLEKEAS